MSFRGILLIARVLYLLNLNFLQVSRYIDASMGELGRSTIEDVDRTYGVLLEEGGEENVSFALQPPLANHEEFTSRPESSISW